ncbi:MAG: hypothetical protein Q8K46_04775 [Deltaproteobacteria bacterium]|nr:hypothetical protein [Deltaproteobacteria bacterium]
MVNQQNIKINSGLPNFLLLDAITGADETTIAGARKFFQAAPWLGIEALAQLGAFHVRQLTGFQKHAFLLKINRFVLPQSETLQGRYLLQGTLVSRSGGAFVYELMAMQGKALEFSGNFLYAVVDYDDVLVESRLRNHYLRIFRCLQNANGNGSNAGARPGSSAPLR